MTLKSIEQAKSESVERAVFTNCGKAERQETPVKPTKQRLTRVPFTVSRLMEFCTRRELVNQTGHDVSDWPLVVLKEMVDNAIDAAEEAEIAPVVSIDVKGRTIAVKDNGPGIPAKTIDGVLDYSIRVSSREAYVSPTRGAQGNALKTILPMGYVLNERLGEEAAGKTIIEAHGLSHHIGFAVDHIKQEPKITHTTKKSPVVRGTKITIDLPACSYYGSEIDAIEDSKSDIVELTEAYAWLNPHLSLRLSWNGDVLIDIKASNPAWNKWLPSWPTSAHWYDKGRFRRYMAAHIANRGNITVREFISEFRGMTGTAKQKVVLAETGSSHVSLHHFFGLHKANSSNIAKLLASLRSTRSRCGPLISASSARITSIASWRRRAAIRRPSPTIVVSAKRLESQGDRVRLWHPPRRPHSRSRAEPESYHGRQLVARYQQSIPATRARWHRPRWNLVGCPCQHISAGYRGAAHGLSARRIHRPG